MKAGVICLMPDRKVRDEATKQDICGICGAPRCPLQAVWLTPLRPRHPVEHLEWLRKRPLFWEDPLEAGAPL